MSALSDAITFTSAALRLLQRAQEAQNDGLPWSDDIKAARDALSTARLHAGRANLAQRVPPWDK